MSYEFFAPIPKGIAWNSSELSRALTQRLPLQATSETQQHKLLFRWADLPLRTEWPEDIELAIDENGVLASIHVGTAEQRCVVLNILSEELARQIGLAVTFEEQ